MINTVKLSMRATDAVGIKERTRDAPVAFKSLSDCGVANASFICPIEEVLGFSRKRQHSARSAVSRLLFTSGPTNIANFVMSIVVFSVKRVFGGGAWPNMFKELLKGVKTKFDSASTIVRIMRCTGIFATIPSVSKRSKFSSFFAVCTRTVPRGGVLNIDAGDTSARRSFAILQSRRASSKEIAAVTATSPLEASATGVSAKKSDHHKHPKAFRGYVLKVILSRGGMRLKRGVIINNRHISLLDRLMCLGPYSC